MFGFVRLTASETTVQQLLTRLSAAATAAGSCPSVIRSRPCRHLRICRLDLRFLHTLFPAVWDQRQWYRQLSAKANSPTAALLHPNDTGYDPGQRRGLVSLPGRSMPVPGETVQPALLLWTRSTQRPTVPRSGCGAATLPGVGLSPRKREAVSSQFILRPGIGCVGEEG